MKLRNLKRNKKAAFEMSITTIVILVIAMALLVMGLVFIRQIFGTATKSVDMIDEQTQSELMNLFGQEGKDIVIKLGSQQSANVKQGTQGFGFIFGIAPDGVSNLNSCKYKILAPGSGTCGTGTGSWFVYGANKDLQFDKISATSAFALVKMNIPDTQQPCDQKFTISVSCPASSGGSAWTRTDFFSINVIKKGFI